MDPSTSTEPLEFSDLEGESLTKRPGELNGCAEMHRDCLSSGIRCKSSTAYMKGVLRNHLVRCREGVVLKNLKNCRQARSSPCHQAWAQAVLCAVL